MRSHHRFLFALAVLASLLCAPSLAGAQTSDRDLSLGGTVSGSIAEGGAAPAISLSVGYEFTPRVALEVDASYMTTLDVGDFPNCPPPRVCVRGGTYSLHARTGSVSASLISRLPVGTSRVRPYLAAGVGVAKVRRQLQDNDLPIRATFNTTGPMLTAGGGVELLGGPRIAVGLDVRYQRIFENDPFIDPDLDLVRIGCSVSYRF